VIPKLSQESFHPGERSFYLARKEQYDTRKKGEQNRQNLEEHSTRARVDICGRSHSFTLLLKCLIAMKDSPYRSRNFPIQSGNIPYNPALDFSSSGVKLVGIPSSVASA
jgi:hypothetical protein